MTDDDVPPPPNEGEWKVVTDLRVSGARPALRESTMDRHDLEQGDYLRVVVYAPDNVSFALPGRRIGTQDRLTIPKSDVEEHALEGEYIDIAFRVVETDGDGES